MYDELKERCRACSQGCIYPSECSYFNKPPLRCMRQLLSEAADAIEKLLAERDEVNADSWKTALEIERDEHRWIPAAERLPEVGVWVLCFCRANSFDVFRMTDEGDWQYGNRSIYMKGYVTHWMPLPEPPKEET